MARASGSAVPGEPWGSQARGRRCRTDFPSVSDLGIEDEIDRRVREKGSATFSRMRDRIAQLQAENAVLRQMLGVPPEAALLVPDSESDDPLDIP